MVSLVIIAALTAHCCHLLIKCRYYAIDHICHLYRSHHASQHRQKNTSMESFYQKSWSSLTFEHLISKDSLGDGTNKTEADLQTLTAQLVKTIQYGDLARMCYGKWGVAVVNVAIVVTQLGFALNYVIFTANTLYAFFPVYNCTVLNANNESVLASSDCQYMNPEQWSHGSADKDTDALNLVNISSSPPSFAIMQAPIHYNASFLMVDNVTYDTVTVQATAFPPAVPDSQSQVISNLSVWTRVWTDAPDLRLLFLVPVGVFMVLALPRSMRGLGFISAVGNVGLMSGAVVVLLALASRGYCVCASTERLVFACVRMFMETIMVFRTLLIGIFNVKKILY